MIKINSYTREAVVNLLPTLNSWCAQYLRAYPYLYAPDEQQIINPSDVMYVNDPNAMIVIAGENNKIIAIASGIPLNSHYLTTYYFSPEIIDKFHTQKFNIDTIWYMGYFLLASEHRKNTDLIKQIYQKFYDHAVNLYKNKICYIEVVRPDNHPMKPQNYLSPEPWEDVINGFSTTGVVIEATWPTIQADGMVIEEKHEIEFFIKHINFTKSDS